MSVTNPMITLSIVSCHNNQLYHSMCVFFQDLQLHIPISLLKSITLMTMCFAWLSSRSSNIFQGRYWYIYRYLRKILGSFYEMRCTLSKFFFHPAHILPCVSHVITHPARLISSRTQKNFRSIGFSVRFLHLQWGCRSKMAQ